MAKNQPIKFIQLFGERNSGTNYAKKVVLNNTVGLKKAIKYGWKHGGLGFPTEFYDRKTGERKVQKVADYKESSDTLFIVVYRDPITWLQSMHNDPHHAPLHRKIPFSQFIRKPWTTYVTTSGQDVHWNVAVRNARISPANLWEDYDSIFELRNVKTEIFEKMIKQVDNVVFVNYELLRDNPKKFVDSICKAYGLEKSATFSQITNDKFNTGKYKPKRYPAIARSDFDFIIDHLDWKTEEQMGYKFNAKKFNSWLKAYRRTLAQKLTRSEATIPNAADFLTAKTNVRCYRNGKLIN